MPDFYVIPEYLLGRAITADSAGAAVDALPVERVTPGGAWVAIPADRVRSFDLVIEQVAPPEIRKRRTDRVTNPETAPTTT